MNGTNKKNVIIDIEFYAYSVLFWDWLEFIVELTEIVRDDLIFISEMIIFKCIIP